MKTFSILFFGFIFYALFSFRINEFRHFYINPNPMQMVVANQDKQNDFGAKIVNIKDGDLNIKWRLIENTLVKGWDYSICNYGQCLAGIPASGKMTTIKKGNKGFINLHLNPFKIKGTGKLSFYVFEAESETEGDTLTYVVTAN